MKYALHKLYIFVTIEYGTEEAFATPILKALHSL